MSININARYEISSDEGDVIDWRRTWRDAELFAGEVHLRNPELTLTIFDRMARSGRPELWTLSNNSWIVKSVRNLQ